MPAICGDSSAASTRRRTTGPVHARAPPVLVPTAARSRRQGIRFRADILLAIGGALAVSRTSSPYGPAAEPDPQDARLPLLHRPLHRRLWHLPHRGPRRVDSVGAKFTLPRLGWAACPESPSYSTCRRRRFLVPRPPGHEVPEAPREGARARGEAAGRRRPTRVGARTSRTDPGQRGRISGIRIAALYAMYPKIPAIRTPPPRRSPSP